MEHNHSSSTYKAADRKTVEKNRRNHMKNLFSNLHSLLPHHPSTRGGRISVVDQLDEAANYIKRLQSKLEKMQEEKERLMGINVPNSGGELLRSADLRPPHHIDVHEIGCDAVEVNLITSLDCNFMFCETIRILHEEGLDIVHASYSVNTSTIFHTIHSKVPEYYTDKEGLSSRISERLNKFAAGAY